MVMLSGHSRPAPRQRRAAPALCFSPEPDGVRFTLAGVEVLALAEGALWIEIEQTLVCSDLHLEKGSSFARGGRMLPPYDTRATLELVAAMVARRRPKRIVSLGDSFHDRDGPNRLSPADRALLEEVLQACAWTWIEGNHDGVSPARLGGSSSREVQIAGLTLRHEPTGAEAEIAGHLHPCARVRGAAGSVRRRCFALDGGRLVMPAMGAFTGGLNVLEPAFAALFPQGCAAIMMSRGKLYPVGFHRLGPD